jgi:antitoxin component YwqK of YwqJK toxin-antitoxin module
MLPASASVTVEQPPSPVTDTTGRADARCGIEARAASEPQQYLRPADPCQPVFPFVATPYSGLAVVHPGLSAFRPATFPTPVPYIMTILNPRKLPLLAALVPTLVLTACGARVLDYRNAQVVDGKVYAGDVSEPFSGKLTNVPSAAIFSAQQGFKAAVRTMEKAMPALTLQYISAAGIDYFPTDVRIPVPVYCDTRVNSGYLDGKVTCKAANTENVVLSMTFANGTLNGEFRSYAPDDNSHLFTKVTFSDGRPDGRMEVYSPSTHRLVHTLTWSNGVLNGDEESFDENTGNRVLHASLVDGKYEGEMTGYAPDGNLVIYRASYTNGLKEGVEEAFDPGTGKPAGNATYVDGKLSGTVRRWDASGKLIYEKEYQNGQEVPDSVAVASCLDRRYTAFNASGDGENVNVATRNAWEAECKESTASNSATSTPTAPPSPAATAGSLDDCVSAWTTAFHHESGDDAMVNADQLDEWRSWCRSGKRPS